MKQFLFLSLLLMLPLSSRAKTSNDSLRNDTTVIIKGRKYVINDADKKINIKVYGKDTQGKEIKDDMVYEATYNDEQTTERRFEFSSPFVWSKDRYSRKAHSGLLYFGFSGITSSVLGGKRAFPMRSASSFDVGIPIGWSRMPLSKEGHCGITAGVENGLASYQIDGAYAFTYREGHLDYESGNYHNSRLIYSYISIPVMIEWQSSGQWLDQKMPFAISFGIAPEIRSTLSMKTEINGEKKNSKEKGYLCPFGLSLVSRIGIGNIGFYGRAALTPLFKRSKAAKMYPYSFGLILFW